MTLTQLAVEDPEAFVRLVDKLRAAGVVKLGALVLGNKPPDGHSTRAADPAAIAEKKHNVMFAATSIRPPFARPQGDSAVPKALVQRRERNGTANGEGHTSR